MTFLLTFVFKGSISKKPTESLLFMGLLFLLVIFGTILILLMTESDRGGREELAVRNESTSIRMTLSDN